MQLYLQMKEMKVRLFALQGTLYDAGSLQNDRSFVKQRKINLVTSIPPSAMHLFNLCGPAKLLNHQPRFSN